MYAGGDGRGRGLCMQMVTEEVCVCRWWRKRKRFVCAGGDGRGRGLCIQVVTEEEEVCVFRW